MEMKFWGPGVLMSWHLVAKKSTMGYGYILDSAVL